MSYYQAHNYDINELLSQNEDLKTELKDAKKQYTYFRMMRQREVAKLDNAKKKDTNARAKYNEYDQQMTTYYKVIKMYTAKIEQNMSKVYDLRNRKKAITASKPQPKTRRKKL